MVGGGDGAPRPQPGISVITELHALDAWAQRLQPGSSAQPRR
jgi:hypothetical protein